MSTNSGMTNEMVCKVMPTFYDLYISGDIDENTLEKFRKDVHDKLNEIDSIAIEQAKILQSIGVDRENVQITLPNFNIHINTYGGSVYPGLGICDIIKELTETYNVTMFCSGYIMSMGIPIILSGTKRVAYKNTTFMIHEISTFTWDKLSKVKEDVKETERLNNILKDIICKKSKVTKKEINEWYEKKRDVFLSAEEAKDYGLVDEII
jgi:ATP-dependent Clp protease protease subunit